ncbi:MAG: polysaccharide pyruvyl transferase family protein [Lamprobacter sp.]|uniref:polysaccharide pyruvyl transferase family protein n=1 Tax=Lamprobacter sp. TaxID=3100796 RepID=UPI002B261BB5|nr:polysaccharide pyruvyl transferase family protein [Lamprobacter sp.]MEA3642474.1 polysaccharide pyruvyl transferase family protein [Lamprobacter sp.]
MKKRLTSFISLTVFQLINTTRKLIPKESSVVVIAPAPPGSLGDQALLEGLSQLLYQRGLQYDEILVSGNKKIHQTKYGPRRTLTASSTDKIAIILLAIRLIRTRGLIIVGADTTDGSYNITKNHAWIDIAKIFDKIGIAVAFVSFSFSDNPKKEIYSRLSKLSSNIEFKSRDPISCERFKKFVGHRCQLTADLAFSMPAEIGKLQHSPAERWITTQRQNKKTLVALNINSLPINANHEQISSSVARAIRHTQETHPDCSFIFLPHDYRQQQSDQSILVSIYEKTECKSNIFVLTEQRTAQEIKYLTGFCDLTITGRMHLAIAALSQGIPVYCFSYKGKFEGLMNHFELKGNLTQVDTVLDPTKLSSFFDYAIKNHRYDLEKVKRHLPSVLAKSEHNIPSWA